MRVYSLALFVILALVAQVSTSQAAVKTETFEVNAIPGQELYSYLARTCDEATWATIAPWAKRVGFQDREFPATTFIVNDGLVTSPDAKFSLKIDTSTGQITSQLAGHRFQGSVCQIIAQIAQKTPRSQASLLGWAIPRAHAEDLETNLTPDDWKKLAAWVIGGAGTGALYGGFAAGLVTLNPLGAAVGAGAGAISGAVGGALLGGGLLVLKYARIKKNRLKIEDQIEDFMGREDVQIVSCSATSVQLRDGARTMTLTKGAQKSVRMAGTPGPTGAIDLKSQIAAIAYGRFAGCASASDAKKWNEQNAEQNRVMRERVAAAFKNYPKSPGRGSSIN